MPPRRKAATKTEASKSTKGATKALEEQDTDPSLLTVAKLREALEEKGELALYMFLSMKFVFLVVIVSFYIDLIV